MLLLTTTSNQIAFFGVVFLDYLFVLLEYFSIMKYLSLQTRMTYAFKNTFVLNMYYWTAASNPVCAQEQFFWQEWLLTLAMVDHSCLYILLVLISLKSVLFSFFITLDFYGGLVDFFYCIDELGLEYSFKLITHSLKKTYKLKLIRNFKSYILNIIWCYK